MRLPGADCFSKDGCIAGYIDRLYLPGRLIYGNFDPEGLLSTLPAVVTAMLGMVRRRIRAHVRIAHLGRSQGGLYGCGSGRHGTCRHRLERGSAREQEVVVEFVRPRRRGILAGDVRTVLLYYRCARVQAVDAVFPRHRAELLTIYMAQRIIDFRKASRVLHGRTGRAVSRRCRQRDCEPVVCRRLLAVPLFPLPQGSFPESVGESLGDRVFKDPKDFKVLKDLN